MRDISIPPLKRKRAQTSATKEAVQERIVQLRSSDYLKRKSALRRIDSWGKPAHAACPALIEQFPVLEHYNENPYFLRNEICKTIASFEEHATIHLLVGVNSEDEATMNGCIQALGLLGTHGQGAVVHLQILADNEKQSPRTRTLALESLGTIASETHGTETIKLLNRYAQDSSFASAACNSLAAQRAATDLAILLGHEQSQTSTAAAQALARLKEPSEETAHAIVDALVDGPDNLKFFLDDAVTLHLPGHENLIPRLRQAACHSANHAEKFVNAIAAIQTPAARKALFALLSATPRCKSASIQNIGDSKVLHEDEIDTIATLANGGEGEPLVAAIHILRNHCKRSATIQKALLPLLDHPEYNVRYSAMHVLGHTGLRQAAYALLKQLKANKDVDESRVIDALGNLGHYASDAQADLMLRLTAANQHVRRAATTALGRIGQPTEYVIQQLIAVAATDDEWTIRHDALLSIVQLGPSTIPHLLGVRYQRIAIEGIELTPKETSDFTWKIDEALSLYCDDAIPAFLEILKDNCCDFTAEAIVKQLGRFSSHTNTLLPVLTAIENDESRQSTLRNTAQQARASLLLSRSTSRTHTSSIGQAATKTQAPAGQDLMHAQRMWQSRNGSMRRKASTMNSSDAYPLFELDEWQRAWLVKALEHRSLPREDREWRIRKELKDTVPRDFEPQNLPVEVYYDQAVTLHGIAHLDSGSPWINHADDLIRKIASTIGDADSPADVPPITADFAAELLGIPAADAQFLLWLLSTLRDMTGVASISDLGYPLSVGVANDCVQRSYLYYDGIQRTIWKRINWRVQLGDLSVEEQCGLYIVRNHPRRYCHQLQNAAPDMKGNRGQMTDLKREQIALLFCDIKGYSALTEHELKPYMAQVLPELALKIDPYREDLIELNTWGDSIFAAHRDPHAIAMIALELRDYFNNKNWDELRIRSLSLRVGLHSGVTYVGEDPIRKRSGLVGGNVNMAARIEPVATEGEVWVSNEFKTSFPRGFDKTVDFDDLGERKLAKKFGKAHLWRLRREREDAKPPPPEKDEEDAKIAADPS